MGIYINWVHSDALVVESPSDTQEPVGALVVAKCENPADRPAKIAVVRHSAFVS
jgi:hypothetical protein